MVEDSPGIGDELRILRKKRWVLWSVALLYLPQMWITVKLTHSNFAIYVVFVIWCVCLCYAVLPVAFAICPRCGNFFHMKGFMPRYLRRCLHCGLHICADKRGTHKSSS